MMAEVNIRVRVMPVWADVAMAVPASSTINEIKLRALDGAQVVDDPAGFEVKFRGALLDDEAQSLADAGVPDDGALIVLQSHRVPVS